MRDCHSPTFTTYSIMIIHTIWHLCVFSPLLELAIHPFPSPSDPYRYIIYPWLIYEPVAQMEIEHLIQGQNLWKGVRLPQGNWYRKLHSMYVLIEAWRAGKLFITKKPVCYKDQLVLFSSEFISSIICYTSILEAQKTFLRKY